MIAAQNFSPWTHWSNRLSLAQSNSPGVYLLARFEDGLPDDVDTRDRHIILVAETHDQTLKGRWKQFDYSAFQGGEGHAGGVTFYRLFNNGSDTAVPSWLYVSAVATSTEKDVADYNKQLKNRLLNEYQECHGVPPKCNAQQGRAEVAEVVVVAGESVEEPKITFSGWTRWVDRDGLTGLKHAGVYALACFEREAPVIADVLAEQIIYVGETCDNDLCGRLVQFDRSAFRGKDGHSGGWSFRSRCVNSGHNLYVSVFPVAGLEEPFRSSFIRHTERRLLWEYVKRWGRRPICNSK